MSTIRERFFQEDYQNLASTHTFDSAWHRFEEYEKKTGVSLDEAHSRKTYIDLFQSMSIRHSNIFDKAKLSLVYYLKFLCRNKLIDFDVIEMVMSIGFDEIPVHSEKVLYYKNVQQLADNIDVSILASGCIDPKRYDMPSAVLYLSWYGFTPEEISEAKRADVTPYGIVKNGMPIIMEEPVLSFMNRLIHEDGYQQLSKGVMFVPYKESPYLIRSKTSEQMKPLMLRNFVWKLNSIYKIYSLTPGVVYKSGVFHRAYIQECKGYKLNTNSLFDVMEAFGRDFVNDQSLASAVKDYERYKALFKTPDS